MIASIIAKRDGYEWKISTDTIEVRGIVPSKNEAWGRLDLCLEFLEGRGSLTARREK